MKRFHLVPVVAAAPDAAPAAPFAFDPIADPPPKWDLVAERGTPAARPGPGAEAVVIDVLRATTTLTVALENGVTSVFAAGSVEEARARRRVEPDGLLCGERGGRIVPGFDLGNSPLEFTRERVGGRGLIFASTNGSQALRLAAKAFRTWPGAFVNARALLERIEAADEVWLIASGARGRASLEDLACAGWFARGLAARGFSAADARADSVAALAPRDAGGVRELVENARDALVLRSLGPAYAADVEFCASLDRVDRAHPMPSAR